MGKFTDGGKEIPSYTNGTSMGPKKFSHSRLGILILTTALVAGITYNCTMKKGLDLGIAREKQFELQRQEEQYFKEMTDYLNANLKRNEIVKERGLEFLDEEKK